MASWNLIAVWIGFALGVLSGAAIGLFFHKASWLGGYDSWSRRLVRLGHIAFFGLAFVNLAFVVTASRLPDDTNLTAASILLIVGAATMPTVCFLAAWKKPMRHLFVVPVVSLAIGCISTAQLVLENT